MAAICVQLWGSWPAVMALAPRFPAAAYVSFALIYLAQPIADLVIYRRVWNLPVAGIGALFRKTAINEAVLGYGGELYLYLWARRRAGLTHTPFAAIKDVNILSAMMGFAFTLVILLLAAAWANDADFVRLLRPFLWPAVAVIVLALCVLAFARRVFSLRPENIRFVTAVHGLRLAATCTLTLVMWSLTLPEVALDVWVTLLAVTLLGARIPFLTNTNLVVSNVVLLLFGPDSSFAILLAGTAVATLGAHLAVVAGLGVQDLWRAVRS